MRRELRKISDYYIDRYRQGNPIYMKHIDNALKGIVSPSKRKTHCGAGRGYVLVKTDGTIYPCHRFGGDIDAETDKKWQLGTIFDGWDTEKRRVLLDYDCRSDVQADCENCLAVNTCGVSCIAVNWACFKNIYKPHPNHCRAYNSYFVEAMRIHYILESEGNALFMKKYHPKTSRSGSSGRQSNRGRSVRTNRSMQGESNRHPEFGRILQQPAPAPTSAGNEVCKHGLNEAHSLHRRGRFKSYQGDSLASQNA
jgi:radical SAM protein with 4Fe4S-binding SPASM domain